MVWAAIRGLFPTTSPWMASTPAGRQYRWLGSVIVTCGVQAQGIATAGEPWRGCSAASFHDVAHASPADLRECVMTPTELNQAPPRTPSDEIFRRLRSRVLRAGPRSNAGKLGPCRFRR
jgi:hypothetical protein